VTWDETLKMRAEIVAAAGDDVALPRRQSLQAISSDPFGGRARTIRSRRGGVIRYDVKFRLR
jgi:hypothetical protein